ncbi:MAG: bifunctional 2',3'-cyclic-nucleotide 2'-phosphodiesterase/3'-nucleotidase [Roseovarius sp.]
MSLIEPLLTPLAQPQSQTDTAEVHLRILGTTDVHANLRAFDYYTNQTDQPYGLTRLATLIRQARDEACNTLLLENGDFLQGTPLSDLTAKPGSLWQDNHPVIAAMNQLGYDASGMGNHEFNFGVDWLLEVLAQADFPTTCGNALTAQVSDAKDLQTLLPPYLILPVEVSDTHKQSHVLNVGILSLVPPQITMWDQYHLAGRIWSHGIVATARQLVPQMRQAGADIVVVLAHSGIGSGADTGAHDPMTENAVLTLSDIPGIDAVMAGHAHQVFPGPEFDHIPDVNSSAGLIRQTPVAMAGFRGSHLGVIDLNLSHGITGWRVSAGRGTVRPVSVSDTPEDHALVAMLEPAHRATIALTQQPLGACDQGLHSYLSLVGKCDTVQVVTRAQARAARQVLDDMEGIDLPILSASAPFKSGGHGGPDHYCDIPAGPIFLRHAADLYPFPNLLCIARITGADLRDWLERATTIFNTIQPGQTDQHLFNPDVPNHTFDMIDGVTYRIDLTQEAMYSPKGENRTPGPNAKGRIRALCYAGVEVRDQDEFAIATNNYRVFGGGPFRGLDPDSILHAGKQPIVDLVSAYIQSAAPALTSDAPSWQFEPIPDAEVVFPTGPGLLRHPGDISRHQLVHRGTDTRGFALFSMPL